jgi:hypothetical protein
MRYRRVVLSCVVASLVSACSMTLPVQGVVDGGAETMTGTATGYTNGAGTLEVKTSKGTTCKGNFVYVTPRQGSGVFNCDDGRSGPFQFVSTGTQGTGTGTFGGKSFTFTFG